MSDIKHDNDLSKHELVQPTASEGENQLKATSDFEDVNPSEDFDYVDPSLDDIEAIERKEVNPRLRTKEEALKMYLQDELDRKSKGQH